MKPETGFRKPRIMPPIWVLFALLAMWALDRWLPLYPLFGAAARPGSWLLIGPGLVILAWPAAAFLRARTGLVPFTESTTLVTSGLYRVSRNPMYLGMALVLAGAAVRFGSLSAWLPLPAFVWIIQRRFILNEERFLENTHGDAYRAYRERVRRWI